LHAFLKEVILLTPWAVEILLQIFDPAALLMEPSFADVATDLSNFTIFMCILEFTITAGTKDEMRVIIVFRADNHPKSDRI